MNKELTYSLEVLGVTRRNVITLLDELSYDQLIEIPKGFNNSILWNAVHNLTVQQLLCYRLSGLECRVDDRFIDPFKKGTSGSEKISEELITEFKQVYLETIDLLKKDYELGVFQSFQEYTTSYNITLRSVDEVINFNNTHEGLHYGYMMALRKLV
ncbi:MAG: DinB family protein [Flavobacteriales bacterium]|nr:DinB family protein [Flavobacteriales bacterium]